MEKVYYLFDGNSVLGVFIDRREAYTEYAITERSEWTALEVVELTPEFGHIERKNSITTILLNGKPYKCVVNDSYKAQQLIDLYEEMEDSYRNYSVACHRIYT